MPTAFESEATQYFRANVGILLMRDDGLVLALERTARPGQWQLPQGGLDAGETTQDAALRELREETGIAANLVHLVAEHPDWLVYELPPPLRSPKHGRGQVQKWLLFWYSGDPDEIDLALAPHHEFASYRWMTLRSLVPEVIYFRRPIYQRLANDFVRFLKE